MAKKFIPSLCMMGLLLSSCLAPSKSDFISLISEADKAILYKYNEDSPSQPIIRIGEFQKEDLHLFINFLSDHLSPHQNCGYDGTLFFYKQDKKLFNLRFAILNNCAYATYMSDDKLIEADLSFEGARYLKKAMHQNVLADAAQ